MNNRFQDENLRLSDFEREVWVVCPACAKKAVAISDSERKTARLFCDSCGCQKETTTDVVPNGTIHMPAHSWFGEPLWLQAPFRNGVFYAYNGRHLDYLERYIGATFARTQRPYALHPSGETAPLLSRGKTPGRTFKTHYQIEKPGLGLDIICEFCETRISIAAELIILYL